MRLATLKGSNPRTISEARDGKLVVVSVDGKKGASCGDRYPNLFSAIEDWENAESVLRAISNELEAGKIVSTIDLDKEKFMAPLPRTYAWLDGSAFIQHVLLVRKARGAEPPEDLKSIPLMYQGVSDTLIGPHDDIAVTDEAYGIDFEGEVAIVVGDVPMGVSPSEASKYIKLILLMNDVSLRNLIPRELATGFGFYHGKPASSFAPFAVTPDELGNSWETGRVHLPLLSYLNGKKFGYPNAGEMHFSFEELISHAAKTRSLTAGTIIGSGTVSNKDEAVGSSCLAEKRMLEQIHTGKIDTSFMKFGDTIEIEILKDGRSIFGKISQKIVKA